MKTRSFLMFLAAAVVTVAVGVFAMSIAGCGDEVIMPPAQQNETGVDPSGDQDGDGVVNAADRCPNAPETYNGCNDGDGCPDQLSSCTTEVTVSMTDPSVIFGFTEVTGLPWASPPLIFQFVGGGDAELGRHTPIRGVLGLEISGSTIYVWIVAHLHETRSNWTRCEVVLQRIPMFHARDDVEILGIEGARRWEFSGDPPTNHMIPLTVLPLGSPWSVQGKGDVSGRDCDDGNTNDAHLILGLTADIMVRLRVPSDMDGMNYPAMKMARGAQWERVAPGDRLTSEVAEYLNELGWWGRDGECKGFNRLLEAPVEM